MGGGFATQPGDLAAVAGRVEALADDLAQGVEQLRAELAGLGDMGGVDEQGRAFAAAYDPVVADALRFLTADADGVRGRAAGLRASGAEYETADGAQRDGFR
jgi:hypothetical protein